MTHENEHLDTYGDSGVTSAHGKVPRWLIMTYILTPLWGFIWFYYFWNGSYGWLDRGYWFELQKAANTTIPRELKKEIEFPDESYKNEPSKKISQPRQ